MSKNKARPSTHSLKHLRDRGYDAEVCEKYVARVAGKGQQMKFAGGYRKDLFGFMDILAFGAGEVVAIQATSKQQVSNHLRKYRRDPKVADVIVRWLDVGRCEIHGWWRETVPNKSTHGTHVRWRVHVVDVTADMLQPNSRDMAWLENKP